MKIKICGLTKPEEAVFLNENAIDYAGMVLFFPKSKRNISVQQAKMIINHLNENIKKVAVMVKPDLMQVREVEMAGFDFVQIHGEISDEVLKYTEIPILKAFNVSDMEQFEKYQKCERIKGYVFDAQQPGSGSTFDWELVKDIPRDGKEYFLAGGLTPVNVAEAIEYLKPDGVDVSSGVEYDDRQGKNPHKIAEFVRNVRA